MRMWALQCGGEWTDMAFFDLFHPRVGTKVFIPYLAYLIEHPAGTVLFDTGPHPQLADDPAARLGSTAETYQIEVAHSQLLVNQLEALRVRPGDVTDIVISHLHYDHAGALERFPSAKVHVQRAEREFAAQPPVYQAGDYVPADFDGDVRWHELDGDTDLFDDGKLFAFTTPGHTRGHQSLLVRLPGRAVVLVGDAAPHPRTLAERALPAVLWNPDEMVASWQRLELVAAENDASLIFPHDPDFRSTMTLGPDACYS